MTPIDKAIKALTEIEAVEYPAAQGSNTVEMMALVAHCRIVARQALSDLSSVRLEAGDVEWLRKQRVPEGKRHWSYWVRDAHNARIARLIAFLGHGEEG
jgi:hypothetical protein